MSSIFTVEQALHHADSRSAAQVRGRALPWPGAFEWLFILTGGAFLFLPFVLLLGETELSRSEGIHWYFWMSVMISSPHVYSTYVRLHRKIQEQRVGWWLGFPGYAAAVAVLGLASYLGYLLEAVTVVNVWQSFHYLRQTYGVGCLYGAQPVFDATDRRMRWWAYHLTFPLLIIGRWDLLYQAWGGQSYNMIPVHFGLYLSPLWLIAFGGFYLQAWLEVRLLLKNKKDYRPLGLICFLICFAIHGYGFLMLSHFQRGFFAVTIFHAVQYLALVWYTERKAPENPTPGMSRLVKWPSLAGFALFWLVLYVLGFGYEQYFTVALSRWWVTASTILLGAISIHHYTVDSFIWRRHVGP